MCLTPKRGVKRPRRRIVWKQVHPRTRLPMHYALDHPGYKKGTVHTVPLKEIKAGREWDGTYNEGIHVYTKKPLKAYYFIIRCSVRSEDWVADGVKGDALYRRIKVLT